MTNDWGVPQDSVLWLMNFRALQFQHLTRIFWRKHRVMHCSGMMIPQKFIWMICWTSIHCLTLFLTQWCHRAPLFLVHTGWYTLNKPYTHTLGHRVSSRPKRMILDCWRKLEYQAKTFTDTGRECKSFSLLGFATQYCFFKLVLLLLPLILGRLNFIKTHFLGPEVWTKSAHHRGPVFVRWLALRKEVLQLCFVGRSRSQPYNSRDLHAVL